MSEVTRCAKKVWSEGCSSNCKRPVKDGSTLCTIHSPEGVAARRAKLEAKWDRRRAAMEAVSASRAAEADEIRRKLAAFPALVESLKQIASLVDGPAYRLAVDAVAKAEGRP